MGEVGDARESAESGRRNEGVFDSAAESVAVMGSGVWYFTKKQQYHRVCALGEVSLRASWVTV